MSTRFLPGAQGAPWLSACFFCLSWASRKVGADCTPRASVFNGGLKTAVRHAAGGDHTHTHRLCSHAAAAVGAVFLGERFDGDRFTGFAGLAGRFARRFTSWGSGGMGGGFCGSVKRVLSSFDPFPLLPPL